MVHLSNKQIEDIASELEVGMDCYIHKKTGKYISIPNELSFGTYSDIYDEEDEEDDDDEFGDDNPFKNDMKKINEDRKSYLYIVPMDSRESYKVMEDFTYTIDDDNVRNVLQKALNRPKPFANFKYDLDDFPDFRKKYFEFKSMRYIEYVKLFLEYESDDENIDDENIDDENIDDENIDDENLLEEE